MNVDIYGAGPSGMMAAWACLQAGHRPRIFEPGGADAVHTRIMRDVVNAGVFLLHEHCDLLPLMGREQRVRYGIIGEFERPEQVLFNEYRMKVYGDAYKGDVSISEYRGVHAEYDGMAAQQLLFDIVKPFIFDGKLPAEGVSADPASEFWAQASANCAIITAPLWASFPEEGWRYKWAASYSTVAVKSGVAPAGEAYVWYAPTPALEWYRASGVFGRFALERPLREGDMRTDRRADETVLMKPIAPPAYIKARMDAIPERDVLFAGRMARWEKGIEQHDVYASTLSWLASR